MREALVTQLVKEVLGPRGGIRETLGQSPLNEYITGVLAPLVSQSLREIEGDSEIPAEESRTFEDETADVEVSAPTTFSPALDPKRRSPTMGLSFVVRSEGGPVISVCLTWARYGVTNEGDRLAWHRQPRMAKIDLQPAVNEVFWIDGDGKQTVQSSAEISLHQVERPQNGNRLITLYVVNRVRVPEGELETAEYHIFQPQIRVVLGNGIKLVQGRASTVQGQDEKVLDFLYRKQEVLARGHMCSAVWKQIDPEKPPAGEVRVDFPESLKEPPFHWVDSELLPEGERPKFSPPDVRTEFVPAYSIPGPDLIWRSDYGPEPELRAGAISELWGPEGLREALEPLVVGYETWIRSLESESVSLPDTDRELASGLIENCKTAARRVRGGLDVLCSDAEARMAFCFANRALDIQSNWPPRRTPLKWYPFQLAFILMSVESVVNPRSQFRDVCDLIWVPTGAGKTEAYLAVVAFALAYRRRKASRRTSSTEDRTGSGVAVIARYTLRLLTIQQFRRVLSLITACELLRSERTATGGPVGWRPQTCNSDENFLWGTSAFSAGLWVGGDVTPNRLDDTWGGDGPVLGALSILRGSSGEKPGEPAQVLSCPACSTILAIPERGLNSGHYTFYLLVHVTSGGDYPSFVRGLLNQKIQNCTLRETESSPQPNPDYQTLRVEFDTSVAMRSEDVDTLWNGIRERARANGVGIELVSARASRPGYFFRSYVNTRGRNTDIDFEIFCPNPSCDLHRSWQGGAPAGWVHSTTPDDVPAPQPDAQGGNLSVHVHPAFRTSDQFTSDRIPIPALTVDDQLYQRLPSIIVATVDKFARPAFEHRAASFFGNVDNHSFVWGYYRLNAHPRADSTGHPAPAGRGSDNHRSIPPLDPPDLILQDELHLIEGPLGSLVGFYETAVDYLNRERNDIPPKYIASTATIRRAEDQVLATFARNIQIFPPPGLQSPDRFFITEREIHQLDDGVPGRLYLGICAPGRGPLTPLVRIWSRLLQTVWAERGTDRADGFWTLTGYFNAVRELAGARALYRQDIPQRIRNISSSDPRPITDERSVELSSRTASTDLPSILDLLNQGELRSPEALFTTSMFGTGVDISRIALMVVNGQPKTTSSYIQSTGRVGRTSGALVVTFFRASRPRDLSHYEFFSGYHRQLHRYVEPITVYPFAPGVIERAAGPVAVFVLRNRARVSAAWFPNDAAPMMATRRSSAREVLDLPAMFEQRARRQPLLRRPESGVVQNDVNAELDRWHSSAMRWPNLVFVEYAIGRAPANAVVLGDPQHQHAGLGVIFEDAPQSLRDIEETTGFQT